jgi:pimeloyl-ACP methyl ester carboxylesterase
MIPRTLEKAVQKAMKSFPAILVTGPRQSGKTTLLTERFSKSHRLVIFDQAGHTPHEEYPEKFNQLALAFLSE